MNEEQMRAAFKRERRYIVFKISDVAQLDAHQHRVLNNLCEAVQDVRQLSGKPELECVVVEKDWPEYELVWRMLEARMAGQAALSSQSAKSVPEDRVEEESNKRKLHDYPILAAFFNKHALGSKMKPSCFKCGKADNEIAIRHLELPDIYICKVCAAPPPPTDDERVRELEKLEECRDFILELNTSGFLAGESKLAKHLAERMETLYHTIDHVLK